MQLQQELCAMHVQNHQRQQLLDTLSVVSVMTHLSAAGAVSSISV